MGVGADSALKKPTCFRSVGDEEFYEKDLVHLFPKDSVGCFTNLHQEVVHLLRLHPKFLLNVRYECTFFKLVNCC